MNWITKVIDSYAPFPNLHMKSNSWFASFDSLFDSFHKNAQSYPKYDLYQLNDKQSQIDVALAGWKREDISVEEHDGVLKISGVASTPPEEKTKKTVTKNISSRSFNLEFSLATYQKVTACKMVDGLLSVIVEIQEVKNNAKKIPILDK